MERARIDAPDRIGGHKWFLQRRPFEQQQCQRSAVPHFAPASLRAVFKRPIPGRGRRQSGYTQQVAISPKCDGYHLMRCETHAPCALLSTV
jgi:hypothetical protein